MTQIQRILIVDDHPIYREGLKTVIDRTVDMTVTDEAGSGLEALSKIQQQEFDLVLLDMSMPGKSGLEVLADIKSIRPKLPVLIVSANREEHHAVRAFKAGASGVFCKGNPLCELFEALRVVALGRRYVSPACAEKVAGSLWKKSDGPSHERLSNRELQVMRMMVEGQKPMHIAETLAMSVKTVATYRGRIFKKLDISSNAELTRYVLENGLG